MRFRSLFTSLSTSSVIILWLAGGVPAFAQTLLTDVVTYHNDNARTGQNLTETGLTLANVNAGAFGKVLFLSTDGKVDAQPLYLSALSIPVGTRNMVYVATEHGSVYGFDADSGVVVWHASTLLPGETPSEAVFG